MDLDWYAEYHRWFGLFTYPRVAAQCIRTKKIKFNMMFVYYGGGGQCILRWWSCSIIIMVCGKSCLNPNAKTNVPTKTKKSKKVKMSLQNKKKVKMSLQKQKKSQKYLKKPNTWVRLIVYPFLD